MKLWFIEAELNAYGYRLFFEHGELRYYAQGVSRTPELGMRTEKGSEGGKYKRVDECFVFSENKFGGWVGTACKITDYTTNGRPLLEAKFLFITNVAKLRWCMHYPDGWDWPGSHWDEDGIREAIEATVKADEEE